MFSFSFGTLGWWEVELKLEITEPKEDLNMVLQKTKLNETCEFTLPTVNAGDYSLRIVLPDLEIEISDLDLRA